MYVHVSKYIHRTLSLLIIILNEIYTDIRTYILLTCIITVGLCIKLIDYTEKIFFKKTNLLNIFLKQRIFIDI